MRILFLSHGYPPTISGVTLVVQRIAREMVRRGHSVRVITASDHLRPYRTVDQGVELVRIRSLENPFWSEGPLPLAGVSALRRLIAEFQPDLIHNHENAVISPQLLRVGRLPGVPRVSSCYFLPRYVTHYIKLGLLNRAFQAAIWKYIIWNLNQFDHVIFSTRSQEQDYLAQGLLAPTTVISNGVDTSRYFPNNGHVDPVVAKYRLPEGKRILFVGRLMPDKKIDLLIRALVQVSSLPAHLLIVGRGAEGDRLAALARELGVQDRVHFLGFVPESDLPAIYRHSDLFAIASICEVQSIPTLQAAVTGLPVVAVEAAALPELVLPAENGYLVEPDSPSALARAIDRILSDPPRQQAFGAQSLAIGAPHAETYTFEAYEQFYRKLISGLPLPTGEGG